MKGKMIKKGVLMIFVMMFLILGGCQSQKADFQFVNDCIELEYGERLADDLFTYVDLSELDRENIHYSSKDIHDFSAILEVGEYTIDYEYADILHTLHVVVKDTTSPQVILKENIKILENQTCQYEDFLEIDERSSYQVHIDDQNVHYDEPGDYVAHATITDLYDNATKQDIPITIIEVEVDISHQSLTLDEGDEQTIKITTNSQNPVVYTSSHENIATVNENGKIHALKAGKTTIHAHVDGHEEKCQVTVQEKSQPKPSTPRQTSYTVYITKTGDCYHAEGCRYLSRSQIALSKNDAIHRGYRACSICHP